LIRLERPNHLDGARHRTFFDQSGLHRQRLGRSGIGSHRFVFPLRAAGQAKQPENHNNNEQQAVSKA
jgi:hypothetical protein